MLRAIELGYRGKGQTKPNPCVGCVIVKEAKIVGEGFHQEFGGPHAELNALRQAGLRAKGATVYLTLEPCAHWGKTPPCAPELVRAGIKRVFIGVLDPNPLVKGRGIQILKKAGIQVTMGLEQAACEALMRAYLFWRKENRPFVILKSAMTMDGKISSRTGDSKWITSELSRSLVHELRSDSDAVLVGCNTIIKDNPQLTTHGKGKNPIRIVLDPHLRCPHQARVFNDRLAPTWVVTQKGNHAKESLLRKKGVEVIRCLPRNEGFPLINILRTFAKKSVSQLFVEGGGETAWGFLKAGLVDEFILFIAPKILGGRDAKTPVEGLGFDKIRNALNMSIISASSCGSDILIRGKLALKSNK